MDNNQVNLNKANKAEEDQDMTNNQFNTISKYQFIYGSFWSISQSLGFKLDQPWETFGLLDQAKRIIGQITGQQTTTHFDTFKMNQNNNSNTLTLTRNVSGEIDNQYTKSLTQKMTVDDFELLNVVGKGSFGKVMQVRKKDTGEIFAMKTLKKSVLVKRKHVEHTQTEREILQQIDHPFIVSLRYAFQTKDKLYMILDYFNGGELFFHLRNGGAFGEERAKFYAAEIACALSCLHDNNYIYRDLKPENILLDSDGHIRLTDFGLSKDGISDNSITHTFCGTPEYLAPEIIKNDGYGKTVDWWSLGTLLYEMINGLPPFYDENLHYMYEK